MATASRPETKHVLCPVAELPPGTARAFEVKGRSIAVFNDEGRLSALRNVCPHHGAPLCHGRVEGYMKPTAPHEYEYSGDEPENRVVFCPWHGYKFRLSDGRSVTHPDTMAVRSYRVEVEDGHVVLWM
jgi:3-phenylpropionate/trans-cinnamate dioxygenase ferredoxin subunit